jgi:hypothetical protein
MNDTTELFQVIITPIYFNYNCVKRKNSIFALAHIYCMN